MALKQLINGVEEIVSPAEEAEIRAQWAKVDAEVEAARLPKKILEIKKIAQEKIDAILPDYMQRNYLAKSASLLYKGKAQWSAEEEQAVQAMQALWDKIDLIRKASNDIESLVQQDITTDITKGWPTNN